MSRSEMLEEYKKEIRSILIAYQKGCYLPEFIRSYKELIGKKLPSRELGYRTDIEFLYAMPDAVRLTATATGEYHLLGIADEKSKHIQKMVFKQKPAKLKIPVRRLPRSYAAPPRFSEPLPRPMNNTTVYSNFKISTTVYNEPKINTTVYNEPKINTTVYNERKINTTVYNESKINTAVSTTATSATTTSSRQTTTPKEEIINLVCQCNKGIPLDDLLYEYEDMYGKSFSYEKYGFSNLGECIECISELDLVEKGDQLIVYSVDIAKSITDANKYISEEKIENLGKSSVNSKKSGHNISAKGSIPESMKKKLYMVAEHIPKGILASDFPGCFEDVLNMAFDLHSFGYNCLADFIDDASDIFVREPAQGSQKDYIIYPVDEYGYESNAHDSFSHDNSPEIGASLIDKIIYNIRTILEANVEGVKLQDVLHVYSINCKDSLRLKDLGFNDLETFLFNIKDRVPLKFETHNGIKSMHLLKLSDSPVKTVEVSSEACQSEAIPFDAQFPDFDFKIQSLPSNFDATKYIPVFVSSVSHPGHLYMQLQEEETTKAFGKIADDLEDFYNGQHSKRYLMKSVHIKVDAVCAALWPTDQHWYRAKILSIPSMETVQVYYVDYGTRDTIPKSLLRYLKKEYTKLPAQALKCCLAYLKPPKNSLKWDPRVKARLLQMCEDLPLMAKIGEIKPDGVYSIVLCDTNGEKDVYINDVLHKEGLADYIVEDSNQNIPASPEIAFQPEYRNLNPLQALQAQYFLQAFAAVAPSFAQNENYLKLLRQVSTFCANPDPLRPNSNVPLNPGIHNPNLFSAGMNPVTNPYAVQSTFTSVTSPFASAIHSNPTAGTFNTPISPPVNPHDQYNISPTYPDIYSHSKSNVLPSIENRNNESEIFDEDDDDIFQQFCQKVCSTNIRHVKRVCLGDGYKIHVIVVESKAYASSGDISQLIWNNKEADYLSRNLQLKEVDFPTINLSEDGNEECFRQLQRLNVKGVQKTSGFKPSILLYPLQLVIKILNIFGHPSISLRTKLTEEIAKFDPKDKMWKEFSVSEVSEPEEDENLLGVTDDDKIERLCLYDLLAMKEGIKCKRMKMMNNLNDSNNSKCVDELGKLEQLQEKVLQRIQEIKEICKLFD